MLTELCKELNNWFNYNQPKFFGTFVIADGAITHDLDLQYGQYFRIIGSIFNDGVHQYTDELELQDETFEGSIWAMAIPPDVIALSQEIDGWKAKYQSLDSPSMSPYTSESFGGYSYSKGGGSGSGSVDLSGTWQGAFADKLNHWRKIRP